MCEMYAVRDIKYGSQHGRVVVTGVAVSPVCQVACVGGSFAGGRVLRTVSRGKRRQVPSEGETLVFLGCVVSFLWPCGLWVGQGLVRLTVAVTWLMVCRTSFCCLCLCLSPVV